MKNPFKKAEVEPYVPEEWDRFDQFAAIAGESSARYLAQLYRTSTSVYHEMLARKTEREIVWECYLGTFPRSKPESVIK